MYEKYKKTQMPLGHFQKTYHLFRFISAMNQDTTLQVHSLIHIQPVTSIISPWQIEILHFLSIYYSLSDRSTDILGRSSQAQRVF